jgi:4-amino-4-deoxychorismate lyase
MTLLALAVSGRGLVDPEEPVVHADDEAFLRGRGAFETMRLYAGRPFGFDVHLGRLSESAARLGLPAPDREEIRSLVSTALEASGVQDGMLRIYATPGREDGGAPSAIVLVAALPPDLEELRRRGLGTISVEFRPADLIGGIKSTSYALNMVAVDRARAHGADDAVFLAEGGTVLEATTSNLLWRGGNTLYTPSLELGILAGVTRAVLLELAPGLGYEVEEGVFPVSELAAAEEAFTSSSVREVMPVVALDGARIGEGAPGEAARALQTALRELACP